MKSYEIKASILINGLFIKESFVWKTGLDFLKFEQKWENFAKKKGFKKPVIFLENPKDLPAKF